MQPLTQDLRGAALDAFVQLTCKVETRGIDNVALFLASLSMDALFLAWTSLSMEIVRNYFLTHFLISNK